MTALELREPTGKLHRFIVRQHRHDSVGRPETTAAKREFRLLEALHGQGLAVPRPIHLDLTGEILPAPYQVLGYVEGEMDLAPQDEEPYVHQLADHLAAIHRVDLSCLDLARLDPTSLPRRAPACPELEAHGSNQDLALDPTRFREALQSAGPPPQVHPPALLHGDYWPGNTLWRGGRLVAVIDWEDAEVGDPLIDLAKARSEIHWLFGPKALATFTTRYLTQHPLDTSFLPHHDLCATVRQARLAGSDLEAFAAYFPPRVRADLTAEVLRERWESFGEQALQQLAS
ncbi:MAG: phosphotransferase [Acidobacteriota bacterium]|nr:phosphotransferase [Acidobacteriota bacterium]